jgi:predicted Zn finger-like uncharacterized protein
MIIECPACNTRYDIKVDLPPEGRSVRCAKCEHVWRAVPIEDEEEDYSPGAGEDFDNEESDGTPGYSASRHIGDGEEEEEEELEPFAETPSLTSSPADETAAKGSGAKSGWFASFLRKNQKLAVSQETLDEPGPQEELEPAHEEQAPRDEPQPRSFSQYEEPEPAEVNPAVRPAISSDALARPASDVRTLDDARAAVRNVFASLGEQRSHQHARPSIEAPITGYTDTEQEEALSFAAPEEDGETGAASWESEAVKETAYAQGQGAEAPASAQVWPEEERATSDAPQGWLHDWQAQPDRQEPVAENDLDAQLRAALQAHFPSHSVPSANPGQTAEDPFLQEDAGDEAAVSETLTAFWKRPAPIRGETSGTPVFQDEEPDPGEMLFDEQLYREIEDTQDHAVGQIPGQQNGALALAAAWGLFLCVAGGLTSGLFAFRDVAVGALPGLASLYRAVGMPVTAQPLIFEGVQYEWSISDFKPVLHIKGAVYNRAQRGVNVPKFIVSIKDNDPALDKEFPASLPVEGDKIAPEERTEFEIELVSPSASITAVQLELRNVR